MKKVVKDTFLLIIVLLATGCSNDFLTENLTSVALPIGESNIYISPDWPASAYQFKLSAVGNADYKIESKPSWLSIESMTGQLTDSVATIHCSAQKNSDYASVGIFVEYMTVKASGTGYKVPVAYISEGSPKIQVASSITISETSYSYPTLQIQNTGLGILLWDVVSMPDWLAVDTSKLQQSGLYISQYNSYSIPLMIKQGENASGNLTGTIVLATNDKDHPQVSVNVIADLGTPQLYINTSAINFGSSETTQNFSFYNYGNGILSWKFENLPDWLTISPISGMYNSYTSYGNIVFTCNRTKLTPGQNTAVVHLKTNDSSHPSYDITVTAVAPGTGENIRTVTGNIVDAVYNKKTNTLYYATSLPNKLVAYDVATRAVSHEIALTKAPTCLAISEDWTKAAVGHNGAISAINLSNNTVANTYTLSYSVLDIAWGENDWFCYTQSGGSFTKLHWQNTATGETYDTNNTSLDGTSFIQKVPTQPYIIGTRNATSPTGFFSFDVAGKSIKSYAHMDLTRFWMSEDGQYIYAQNNNIYRTTSSTGSTNTFNTEINAIGKISFSDASYYGISFISQTNNYLWVIRSDSYLSSSGNSIYQIENNDYTTVKKYTYDTLFQPDSQTSAYTVMANYVFANNNGAEIYILCKSTSGNNWIIQFVPVTN